MGRRACSEISADASDGQSLTQRQLRSSQYFESIVNGSAPIALDDELRIRRDMSPPSKTRTTPPSAVPSGKRVHSAAREIQHSVERLHRANSPHVGGGPVSVRHVRSRAH